MNLINKDNKVDLLLRYSGGKYYALKLLRPFWERINHLEYIEPFFGGGSVYWTKPKSKKNWINDIDPELIFLLKFIKNKENLIKLINELDAEPIPSKKRHSEIKSAVINNDTDRAFKYFYLNRTSFSGKLNNPHWGFRPKRSLPIDRWKERLIPCAEKLKGTKITNKSFQTILKERINQANALIYLDPPYFLPKKNSHYRYSFSLEDHAELNDILKQIKTPFFLSYDDCSEIRDLYKNFNINEIKFYYRVSNSNNEEKKRIKKKELVITNYKI